MPRHGRVPRHRAGEIYLQHIKVISIKFCLCCINTVPEFCTAGVQPADICDQLQDRSVCCGPGGQALSHHLHQAAVQGRGQHRAGQTQDWQDASCARIHSQSFTKPL